MLPKLENKLTQINKKYAKNYFLKRKYYVLQQNECYLIVRFFNLLLYMFLIFFIAKGTFTVDILVLMIGYYQSSTGYFKELIDKFVTIREVNVSVKRINNILNYQNKDIISCGNYQKDDIDGIIEFKNVNFKYHDKEILHNFSIKLMSNKVTVIIITHKPSLMKKSDQIIVIDHGKVVGIGKHHQLLTNKYYERLQK